MSSALLSRTPSGLWVPGAGRRAPAPPAGPGGPKTRGGAVARVAQGLGQPGMPWQRYVWDVAGEVDDRGIPVYSLILVSVQRQSGKTTAGLAQSTQRCLGRQNRKTWWTAQTGQDARKKWSESVDLLLGSALAPAVRGRPKRTNGAEALIFQNGSQLRPHPPTRDSLHGEQSDQNDVDEAWVFTEEQGADLLQAITPTQLTRPGAQTFIWSTRGDASSTWFHDLLAAAVAGEIKGAAVFDWGIPLDSDPEDLANIAAHHPAYGHTVTMDALERARANFAKDPAGWARAYGNVASGALETVIPGDAYAAARTEDTLPAGRPAYGVAVSLDGDWGSLWAAVLDDAGRPWVELVDRRPGRSWLVDRVRNLRDTGAGVAVDRRGPAGPVADALELAGVNVLTPTTVDYAAACQDVFDRLTHRGVLEDGTEGWVPQLLHRDQAGGPLDDAVDVAARRRLEEGGWVWSRKRSTGTVDSLEGLTLAAWAVARAPVEIAAPRAFFR